MVVNYARDINMAPNCWRITYIHVNLWFHHILGWWITASSVALGNTNHRGLSRRVSPANESFFILDTLSLLRTRAIVLGNLFSSCVRLQDPGCCTPPCRTYLAMTVPVSITAFFCTSHLYQVSSSASLYPSLTPLFLYLSHLSIESNIILFWWHWELCCASTYVFPFIYNKLSPPTNLETVMSFLSYSRSVCWKLIKIISRDYRYFYWV